MGLRRYGVGSDAIAAPLAKFDVKYVALVPGASYRACTTALWASPVDRQGGLPDALRRGVDIVRNGGCHMIEVRVHPGYADIGARAE